jgi:hypothetical protein
MRGTRECEAAASSAVNRESYRDCRDWLFRACFLGILRFSRKPKSKPNSQESCPRKLCLSVFAVDGRATIEQRELATADSKDVFSQSIDKEIHMSTNQPIELGRVSEETKTTGVGSSDSMQHPFTDPNT